MIDDWYDVGDARTPREAIDALRAENAWLRIALLDVHRDADALGSLADIAQELVAKLTRIQQRIGVLETELGEERERAERYRARALRTERMNESLIQQCRHWHRQADEWSAQAQYVQARLSADGNAATCNAAVAEAELQRRGDRYRRRALALVVQVQRCRAEKSSWEHSAWVEYRERETAIRSRTAWALRAVDEALRADSLDNQIEHSPKKGKKGGGGGASSTGLWRKRRTIQ